MTPETQLPSQERIAGALAYILFFVPFLMKIKTDSTMFHAKQSLIILFISLIVSFIPFIGWMLSIVIMITILWCAYQAFLGNKFMIPVLGEKMDMILSQIGVLKFFSTK